MVPGAGAGCPVPLLARTAELRGPAHLLPRPEGRATFRGFGGYFGGVNKRCMDLCKKDRGTSLLTDQKGQLFA